MTKVKHFPKGSYERCIEDFEEEPLWRRQAWVRELMKEYPNVPTYKLYRDLGLDQYEVKTMPGVVGAYERYIENLNSFRVHFGWPSIDRYIRGIAVGEVCGYIARSGVGKTVFAQNLIYRISEKQNLPIMFFSLEQQAEQTYERLAAISMDLTTKKVESAYVTCMADDMSQDMTSRYKKLVIVDEDGMSFPEMEEHLGEAEAILNEKIPFVIIDYLGYMRGRGSDYERVSRLSRELKAFAKRRKVAVFCIHQTSREAGSGGTPVTIKSARDSGVFEESCDYILGAWRPELNDDLTEYEKVAAKHEYKIAILKNRGGELGRVDLTFNAGGANMRIEEDE